MFKKNGFTLIEMLAVVTILGIISLLAFPYANNLLKKSKDNEYNRFLDDIYLATEAYLVDNSDNYAALTKEDGVEYVSLEKVVKGGYLKSTTVNPKTGEKIDLNKSVKVTNKNKKYNYALMDKNYDTNAYVSDGLVLHYDGYKKPVSENGNLLWKDLSGNNNDARFLSLNSSVYEDPYQIDNVSLGQYNYLRTSNVIKNNSEYSIQIVLKPNDPDNFGDIISFYQTDTNDNRLEKTSTDSYNWYVGSDDTTLNMINVGSLNLDITNKEKSSITIVTNELNSFIMKNNSITYTQQATNNKPTSDNIYFSYRGPVSASVYRGNFYSIRIYNRALTEDEIQKNYEIDKERFGL